MNSQELRIGNLVGFEKFDGTGLSIGEVTSLSVRNHHGIDSIGVCRWPIGKEERKVFLGETQTFGKAVGIPLTEKTFEKLKIPTSFSFASNFEGRFKNSAVWIEEYGEGEELLPHIQFVHQWQNLHYLLTGQELKIEE